MDGELHTLPLVSDNNELWANQEGNNIIVQTASGLRVLYDTSSYVLVTVPGTYQGHMCGLCGNFNDDKSDDLLLPDGTSARSVDEFGASWKVPSDGAACIDGCGERCPMCDDARTAPYRAEGSCGLIQAASGPFSHCHALVSPAAYFGYCLYDLCAADGARETLCRSLQAYAAACQAAGAQIGTWRSTSFCRESPACSPHSLLLGFAFAVLKVGWGFRTRCQGKARGMLVPMGSAPGVDLGSPRATGGWVAVESVSASHQEP